MHCHDLTKSGLLQNSIQETMNESDVRITHHLISKLDAMELIGFVLEYSKGSGVVMTLIIHSFALVKTKDGPSNQYISIVCVLICLTELTGSSINERILQILQLMLYRLIPADLVFGNL